MCVRPVDIRRPAIQATSAYSGDLRRSTSQVIPYHELYIWVCWEEEEGGEEREAERRRKVG